MSKNISILLVIIVLALGGWWLYSANQSAELDNQQNTNQNMEENNESDSMVQEFTVLASNFKYSVTEMRVKQGETVKIKFINEEGFHDWVLDEFNAATSQMQAGNEETIEFVADKSGEFEYYCSVGQHRDMGMVGKLIVE